jgi:predicted tellurium resistance membrane protein TerC
MENIGHLLTDPAAWLALATLVVMEVVLGIDNLVFVALLTNKLPEASRGRARTIGIGLALILRLALLGAIAFIVGLTQPVITLQGHSFSWRDLILLAGGLFLVWKATREIHETAAGHEHAEAESVGKPSLGFASAIAQILVLDIVFSVDSILTAVGMVDERQQPVMYAAVIIAVALMMAASGPIAAFIRRNPSIVMLALGFLLMIGMSLIAEGFEFEVPKGYIYAAMAFSAFVEGLNMLARRGRRRVRNGP